MPRYLDAQASTNIISSDDEVKSDSLAMLMQGPFTRFVQLRRIDGKGGVPNYWELNDGSDGLWVRIDDRHYVPSFVVRGISTNDKDNDGESVRVDLRGDNNAVGLVLRLFAGLDRPYQVTRIHLHNIMQNDNINSVILLG